MKTFSARIYDKGNHYKYLGPAVTLICVQYRGKSSPCKLHHIYIDVLQLCLPEKNYIKYYIHEFTMIHFISLRKNVLPSSSSLFL